MTVEAKSPPHAAQFRHYAEALLGNERSARAWTDATISSLYALNNRNITPDDTGKTNLYEHGHRILAGAGVGSISAFRSDASNPSRRLIDDLDILDRAAIILVNIEGFSLTATSSILNIDYQSAEDANSRGLKSFLSQLSATSLVVENEPLIAMDISNTLEDIGLGPAYVAQNHREAIEYFRDYPTNIVLMDIELNDGFTGIDAANEILSTRKVPLIFVTAYPEKLLEGSRPDPTLLITKPFQRSTLRAAVAQALLHEYIGRPSNAPHRNSATNNDNLPIATLPPLNAPLDATVTRKRLHLGPRHHALSPLSDNDVEATRLLHLRTASRLETMLEGSNCRSVYERISEIRSTLTDESSSEFSIKLGIQVRGMQSLLPRISHILDDTYYSDIHVFVDDLREFCNHFKNFREFIQEALRDEASPSLVVEAARDVARVINLAPSEAVSDDLKNELQSINSENVTTDAIAGFSLVRSVGNIIRSAAREVLKATKDLALETGASFRKKVGETLGNALGGLFITIVSGAAAYALATLFPKEFGWIIEIAKTLMK